MESIFQKLEDTLFDEKEISVYVLRLDLIHPSIGGNKYFKLKYNLEQAKLNAKSSLLSFGGAYSNHIAALAAAGKEFNLATIGFIRGEELAEGSNNTLRLARENGMQLNFIDRETYRKKQDPEFIQSLLNKYNNSFIIPEGGSNVYAVKGCVEIVNQIPNNFDAIMCACGTGGTIAGISMSLNKSQKAIGIPVLKGANFLEAEIKKMQLDYIEEFKVKEDPHEPILFYNYHFGGYAKTNEELESFKRWFELKFSIELDKIYTSKVFYAFFDLVRKNYFEPKSTIVLIHTGGLQGN